MDKILQESSITQSDILIYLYYYFDMQEKSLRIGQEVSQKQRELIRQEKRSQIHSRLED